MWLTLTCILDFFHIWPAVLTHHGNMCVNTAKIRDMAVIAATQTPQTKCICDFGRTTDAVDDWCMLQLLLSSLCHSSVLKSTQNVAYLRGWKTGEISKIRPFLRCLWECLQQGLPLKIAQTGHKHRITMWQSPLGALTIVLCDSRSLSTVCTYMCKNAGGGIVRNALKLSARSKF